MPSEAASTDLIGSASSMFMWYVSSSRPSRDLHRQDQAEGRLHMAHQMCLVAIEHLERNANVECRYVFGDPTNAIRQQCYLLRLHRQRANPADSSVTTEDRSTDVCREVKHPPIGVNRPPTDLVVRMGKIDLPAMPIDVDRGKRKAERSSSVRSRRTSTTTAGNTCSSFTSPKIHVQTPSSTGYLPSISFNRTGRPSIRDRFAASAISTGTLPSIPVTGGSVPC